MNDMILLDNQRKRQNYSLKKLFGFAMFAFWQMGFIYFMGPALTVNGRTALPINMDNLTALIAVSYVVSILYMIFLPNRVVWAERIGTMTALATVLGLFIPLPDQILRGLIYAHVFCCCVMIGFESFIIVNFFSEESAVTALTAGYGLALALIAIVQNDFVPMTFPVFRLVTMAALLGLLRFAFHLPAAAQACPQYVGKGSGLIAPRKLLAGTGVLMFVGALMAVSGPSIAAQAKHGVFVMYLADAAASALIYLLYKKREVHSFRSISVCIGLGCIGFLLMYTASYAPALYPVSCAMIGVGMIPCQMLPLYGLVLMKSYPSRYISPLMIGLALAAVLVQSSMVEMFRSAPVMLCLAYAVIMVILVILYLQVEPFFLYTLHRKIPENSGLMEQAVEAALKQEDDIQEKTEEMLAAEVVVEDSPLARLSKREMEVVDLIARGFANAEIAGLLFISPHTVNDHTKKIYKKLNVHSRMEVAVLVNRQNPGNV